MKIQLLYFDGCPSWESALVNLKTALSERGWNVSVDLVKIQDGDEAQRLRFQGSPSIQVNGVDLWPETRKQFSMSCRVYKTPEGLKGWPTVEMIQKVLSAYKGRG